MRTDYRAHRASQQRVDMLNAQPTSVQDFLSLMYIVKGKTTVEFLGPIGETICISESKVKYKYYKMRNKRIVSDMNFSET